MPHRTKPPYRADHVGSLFRPDAVKRAREDLAAGRITAAALRAIEDEKLAIMLSPCRRDRFPMR